MPRRQSPWLELLKHGSTACPRCSGLVETFYCGDLGSRVGFSIVRCASCRRGVQVSRLRVPDGLPMFSFDDPEAFGAAVGPVTLVSL